jgi:tight adherence protein C
MFDLSLMNNPSIIAIASGIVLFLGLLLTVFGLRSLGGLDVKRRLDDFVGESGKIKLARAPVIVQQVFSGSLFSRILNPPTRRLANYFYRHQPAATSAELDRKLLIAHNPFGLRAREFTAIHNALFFIGILLAGLINFPLVKKFPAILAVNPGENMFNHFANARFGTLYIGLILVLTLYLVPIYWLNLLDRRVIHEIRQTLPDALDMLSVCADAGLGFDQALQRVSDYWQTAISLEFRRVVSEMEVGMTRAEALRALSTRLRIDELSSFVAVIIQSDLLGMRIADVLHSQAEQMRIVRQLRAKEIAYRLPAQMILPLGLLILPAVFAVILGPLVPTLLTAFP